MAKSLTCPHCGSEEVTVSHVQLFMVNTCDHYCHSVKTQDADSESECLDCGWKGYRGNLVELEMFYIPEELKPEAVIEEDEAPEVDESEPQKSKLGEVYQLGRHRLVCLS